MEPSPICVFCDFDGTLSPIVPRPEDARPVPEAAAALQGLVNAGWVVGVISGRPVRFLQDVLGVEGLVYLGLHGLERAAGLVEAKPVAEVVPLLPALDIVRSRLAMRMGRPEAAGAELEDKTFALTLHYRRTPDPERAGPLLHDWALTATKGEPFVVHAGKRCWEIQPDVTIDKGTVLTQEVRRVDASAVMFCGDDVGDLHAFDALDHLSATGTHVTRVVVTSAEVPPELVRRADLVFTSPQALVEYLTGLA